MRGKGSKESDPLEPLGEYSNSCVARERIFDFYSLRNDTPVALIRLSYAVDLRYGVLFDIARRVYCGDEIDLRNGLFNCIWQGDANEMIIRALALAGSPTFPINLTAPVWLSVRETAEQLARLMGKEPRFQGVESESALLSDTRRLVETLGVPPPPLSG